MFHKLSPQTAWGYFRTPRTCSLLWYPLFSGILFIGFWIRIQGVDLIPNDHFTETDGYFYYWQAQTIAENGKLPARDMHRWLPLGRDLGQTLNLYKYALAYTYKALFAVFPSVTLYQVCIYIPVVCFCIGLAALCLFLYHTHGILFSGSVGILLATLPGSIESSTAGFGDRDAWCLMIGLLAVISYLTSLQAKRPPQRILWTLLSGLTVFIGGLSWEGFGVFLTILLCVELWRFLTSETEEGLGFYLLWVLCFVPTLYLASPAYRNGYVFAKHLFAFMLMPPLVILAIRAFRYVLMEKIPVLRQNVRPMSLVLTLASLALASGYVLLQHSTFADTTVPLSQNSLMQSVTELKPPNLKYWSVRYGTVFFLGGLGFIIVHTRKAKTRCLVGFPVTLFLLTLFFRGAFVRTLGVSISDLLFFVSLAATIGCWVLLWQRRSHFSGNERIYIACAAWFILWCALTRDARRYDFFTGFPFAFFTTEYLIILAGKIRQKITTRLPQNLLQASIVMILLAGILFFIPLGAHATRAIWTAKHMRPIIPANQNVEKTFQWMKAELPQNSVVAGNWRYGSQLNVLGGVKTIIDQDHYIQHWIHLYYRYLFCGHSEKEALEFLKSHEATHLMLTEVDVVRRAHINSAIGSRSEHNKTFEIIELQEGLRYTEHLFLLPKKETSFFKNLQIDSQRETHTRLSPIVVRHNGTSTNIPYVAFYNKERKASTYQDGAQTGGLILYFDEQHKFQKGYYVPPIAWDNFAFRLFLRGVPIAAFKRVFETQTAGSPTSVKVWEIHYPPDIHPDVKYLKTGIPEIDAQLKLQ